MPIEYSFLTAPSGGGLFGSAPGKTCAMSEFVK